MKQTTVLLVDDHDIMRLGLASLLGTCKEIKVIGEANCGASGIDKALKLRPDVIIMDLMMPDIDGSEATRQILEKWPEANILILTTFGSADGIAQALTVGARGAVLKNVKIAELRKTIAAVAKGQRYVSEDVELSIANDPPLPPLTERQKVILDSVTRGLSNADIAKQLGISVQVVKNHLNLLFQKIGAANRTEAAIIAVRKYLLKI